MLFHVSLRSFSDLENWMEQWIADGRNVIRDRGMSLVPPIAEEVGFSMDCTGGLRGILKRVVKSGIPERGQPQPYAQCLVKYQYRPGVPEAADGLTWDETYMSVPVVDENDVGEPLEVVVGAGQVAQGFDESLITMLCGEVCDVWLDPAFAFRDNSLRTAKGLIPPNTPVLLRLELVDFENPLSPRSRITVAEEKHKSSGNDAFRAGRYDEALAHYQRALKTLGSTLVCGSGLSGEERLAVQRRDKEVRVALFGNMAACAFQLSQMDRAMQFVERGLKLEPLHVKSLLRKTAILRKLQKYSEAQDAVRKGLSALGSQGECAEARQALETELATINAEEVAQNQAANALFRKML